jgi:MFS family permease
MDSGTTADLFLKRPACERKDRDDDLGTSAEIDHAQRWVLAVTAAASLLVVLDALVVSTALTTIQADFGASVAQLEWTVNGYGLSFAVLLMTATAIGDRYGRRRMFVVGLGVFALASVACAAAPGIGWLIAARVAQGAGAAFVMPLASYAATRPGGGAPRSSSRWPAARSPSAS